VPVVLAFPASGMAATVLAGMTGLPAWADEHSVLLVVLESEGESAAWNAGGSPGAPDDVRYVTAVMDAVNESYCIDQARTFAYAPGREDVRDDVDSVAAIPRCVVVDDSLTTDDIAALGNRFRSFNPANLVMHSLPIVGDSVGGAAIVRMIESEAEPILEAAIDEQSMALGDDHPRVADYLSMRASLEVRRGKIAEARADGERVEQRIISHLL